MRTLNLLKKIGLKKNINSSIYICRQPLRARAFLAIILVMWVIGPAVFAKPHFQIPLYRINGNINSSTSSFDAVGSWRFFAKINSAGGWQGDPWTWEARDWSFDLDCTIDSGDGMVHIRLRNFRYSSVGGWAYWYGKGYGKRDAGPYEFGASGYVNLYVQGELIDDYVYMDASLIRSNLDQPGVFSITIEHPIILALSGGEFTGFVKRFQVIDFQSLK